MILTKMTQAGLDAFADAAMNGTPIQPAEIAFGDGNGAPITPTGDETALYNEVARFPTTDSYLDPEHPNWIVVETEVPGESNGYTIREIGIFDIGGTLLAICAYPEHYRHTALDGPLIDWEMILHMEVTNASEITIIDGGSVFYASRAYVQQTVLEAVNWYTLNW